MLNHPPPNANARLYDNTLDRSPKTQVLHDPAFSPNDHAFQYSNIIHLLPTRNITQPHPVLPLPTQAFDLPAGADNPEFFFIVRITPSSRLRSSCSAYPNH
jgi:hypothetical protein